MLNGHQPTDPDVHADAIEIARLDVHTIRALLRPEEVQEALREFYQNARGVLERREEKRRNKCSSR